VKSHYQALIHKDIPNLNKRMWKLRAVEQTLKEEEKRRNGGGELSPAGW
jgi:hypothetical protein